MTPEPPVTGGDRGAVLREAADKLERYRLTGRESVNWLRGQATLAAAAAVPDRAAPTEGAAEHLAERAQRDALNAAIAAAAPTEGAGEATTPELLAAYDELQRARKYDAARAERDALRDEVVIARAERDAALSTVRRIEGEK